MVTERCGRIAPEKRVVPPAALASERIGLAGVGNGEPSGRVGTVDVIGPTEVPGVGSGLVVVRRIPLVDVAALGEQEDIFTMGFDHTGPLETKLGTVGRPDRAQGFRQAGHIVLHPADTDTTAAEVIHRAVLIFEEGGRDIDPVEFKGNAFVGSAGLAAGAAEKIAASCPRRRAPRQCSSCP